MESEAPVPHEVLRHILARPHMYVGPTENLLEAVWVFLSGFDSGYGFGSQSDEGFLVPPELIRHIKTDLGLQFNEMGIVSAIMKTEPRPDAAFEILREMIGDFYGCSFDLNSFRQWKREHAE